jgi:hypothetical protein
MHTEPIQPVHDGNQTLHVGRVARPEFAADRIAVAVQHHAHHHLLQVGAMILRVAALAEGRAAFAFEVDRGGVEEHDVQVGEQVAAPREQSLLNDVLVGAGSERGGPVLLVFRKFLSQPGHGPVELVQVQTADTFDGIVVLPFLGGTVATGREEAMEHGEEDGPLDGEFEASVREQGGQDFVYRVGLPKPLEDEGRSDSGTVSDDAVAMRMGAEDGEFLREPAQGLNQRVQLAVGQEFVKATETVQDALLHLAVDPHVIDDEEIGSGTVGLGANEQLGAPVSLPLPYLLPHYKDYSQACSGKRDTTLSVRANLHTKNQRVAAISARKL